MPHIIWSSDEQKKLEWSFAKEHLIQDGKLLPNGTKLRREGYEGNLSHSFIVMDNQILAVAEKGNYWGRKGRNVKTKLAENESDDIFKLKIATEAGDDVEFQREAKVAYDLGVAGQRASRSSESKTSPTKHYLAYKYLGNPLNDYLDKNKNLSLDQRYELAIKTSLALSHIHTGIKSKTRQGYTHNNVYLNNVLIDDNGNIHFSNWTEAEQPNWPFAFESDIVNLLLLFFIPEKRRHLRGGNWIFGDFLGKKNIAYEPPFLEEGKLVPLNHSIHIYKEEDDKNEDGTFSKLHYMFNDLNGDCQTGVIDLHLLGIANVKPLHEIQIQWFDINNQDIDIIEQTIIKNEIARGCLIDSANGNPNLIALLEDPLFELLKDPIKLRERKSPLPTAFELAESLTLCRFGLKSHKALFKILSAEERVEIIESLSSLGVELNVLYQKSYELLEKQKVDSVVKDYLIFNLLKVLRSESSPDKLSQWLSLDAPTNEVLQKLIDELFEKFEGLKLDRLKVKEVKAKSKAAAEQVIEQEMLRIMALKIDFTQQKKEDLEAHKNHLLEQLVSPELQAAFETLRISKPPEVLIQARKSLEQAYERRRADIAAAEQFIEQALINIKALEIDFSQQKKEELKVHKNELLLRASLPPSLNWAYKTLGILNHPEIEKIFDIKQDELEQAYQTRKADIASAELIVKQELLRIKDLVVENFSQTPEAELVRCRNEVLKVLTASPALNNACKILRIPYHPDINEALAAKHRELDEAYYTRVLKEKETVLAQIKFDYHLTSFLDKILLMDLKLKSNTNYRAAIEKAEELCTILQTAKKDFLLNDDLNDAINGLRRNVREAVENKTIRDVLSSHREWQGTFLKLIIDFASLLSTAFHKRFGIFAKTETEQMLNNLQEDVCGFSPI